MSESTNRHPFLLRWWHILSGITLLLILCTVFLRKTFFFSKTMAALLREKAEQNGIVMDKTQSFGLAKDLQESMFQWHYYLGFTLAALLILRIFVRSSNFSKKIPSKPAAHTRLAWHDFGLQWSYRIFYLCLIYMAVSGLTMYFEDALKIPGDYVGLLKEGHELIMWFFPVFILAHIIGVLNLEKAKPGWLSRMIP